MRDEVANVTYYIYHCIVCDKLMYEYEKAGHAYFVHGISGIDIADGIHNDLYLELKPEIV